MGRSGRRVRGTCPHALPAVCPPQGSEPPCVSASSSMGLWELGQGAWRGLVNVLVSLKFRSLSPPGWGQTPGQDLHPGAGRGRRLPEDQPWWCGGARGSGCWEEGAESLGEQRPRLGKEPVSPAPLACTGSWGAGGGVEGGVPQHPQAALKEKEPICGRELWGLGGVRLEAGPTPHRGRAALYSRSPICVHGASRSLPLPQQTSEGNKLNATRLF